MGTSDGSEGWGQRFGSSCRSQLVGWEQRLLSLVLGKKTWGQGQPRDQEGLWG